MPYESLSSSAIIVECRQNLPNTPMTAVVLRSTHDPNLKNIYSHESQAANGLVYNWERERRRPHQFCLEE